LISFKIKIAQIKTQ